MKTVIHRGTKVGHYYLAQTPEDQVIFAVNPKIGGPEHHAYRWLSYPELEKLSPPRLLPVISWRAMWWADDRRHGGYFG